MSSSGQAITIMGKTAGVTRRTVRERDTEVGANRAGCAQIAALKHFIGKLTARGKCGRRRRASNRDEGKKSIWESFTWSGLQLVSVH